MGLFAYTLAGGSLILIGGWESLVSDQPTTASPSSSVSTKKPPSSSSSSVTFVAVTVLSFLFVLNSLVSLIDAHNFKDSIGFVLQLEVIAIASLFLVYSIIGVLTHVNSSMLFPSSILNLLCLFGFIEEFMLFYLQRKDISGIENQYYDLLLVPIGVCVVSTMLELKTPKARYARLGRGIGLILQGTWLIQMGLSFFSSVIANGCSLHEKSRGNFTVKCKGHPEYHRGRAIATLQFNCHLAFLVVMVVGLYSFVSKKRVGGGFDGEYRQIGAEMQAIDGGGGGGGYSHQQFTLDSDDDDDKPGQDQGQDEIKEVRIKEKGEEVNGLDSH
ncbi:uncharacterized protein LOC124914471 [Impatiens glandulifera]|uniref:uncharacterized protein LOC124914471 n=1 Tax=Impatiens glandulifera TaxID=253017 RepID=UPI001FB08D7B|nr:uncharacterized protein LOC124914471 [Impatiens glandulifera]